MFLALLLALAAAETPGPSALEAKVRACGVSAADLSVQWDDELQDVSIVIRTPADRLGERQIGCLAHLAAAPEGVYQFTAPGLQQRVEAAVARTPEAAADRRRTDRGTRSALAAQGLLAPALRLRAAHLPLADKVRRAEALAGFPPGAAARVSGDQVVLAFSPGPSPSKMERWTRLMNVLDVVVGRAPGFAVEGAATAP